MDYLHTVGQIILQNLWGFDTIIFVVAVLTLICYFASSRAANYLYQALHFIYFIPEHLGSSPKDENPLPPLKESDVVALRKRSVSLYTLYANLTGIFPLLGILGTVLSLLPMVMDMANVQQNFFAALTSTFWGLVFAILFKFLDGFLSAKIEDNDKNTALLLDRNSKRFEDSHG